MACPPVRMPPARRLAFQKKIGENEARLWGNRNNSEAPLVESRERQAGR